GTFATGRVWRREPFGGHGAMRLRAPAFHEKRNRPRPANPSATRRVFAHVRPPFFVQRRVVVQLHGVGVPTEMTPAFRDVRSTRSGGESRSRRHVAPASSVA